MYIYIYIYIYRPGIARSPRGNHGGPEEWRSQVAAVSIVFYFRFFTRSNPHVDRCSNPPSWDPLSSPHTES